MKRNYDEEAGVRWHGQPQRMQLVKGKADAVTSIASLVLAVGVTYFTLFPEKYDKVTDAVNAGLNAISHHLSVWQTKLAIRALPETDGS